MYDSAFITQFPTLYKNTQERHVSGRETWEIGSVLEGGGKKKKAGGGGGASGWGGPGEERDDVSYPAPHPSQKTLSDKLGHPDT